ncbi:MAG: HAD-IA family hydrolase [Gaiellaceae bacterium]
MTLGLRTTVLSPAAVAGEYSAVLLDLDGTLVDSQASIDRAWSEWCRRYDVDHSEVAHLVQGRTAVDLIGTVRPGWPRARVTEAARFQLQVQEEDPEPGTAAAGARELLEALASESRWAVVTACSERLARHRLASSGLPEPRVLVSVEDVARGKPDPEPYLVGAGRSDADPADCLVIEDAPAGVRSGLAAGCAVVAVATTHAASDLREAAAVISDLTQLRMAARVR